MHLTTQTWLDHDFTVYHAATTAEKWNDVPGIYVFASWEGQWIIQYVGQTNSFEERFADHHRWEEAFRAGARYIHACPVAVASQRDEIEARMIQWFNPPLNRQKPTPRGLVNGALAGQLGAKATAVGTVTAAAIAAKLGIKTPSGVGTDLASRSGLGLDSLGTKSK